MAAQDLLTWSLNHRSLDGLKRSLDMNADPNLPHEGLLPLVHCVKQVGSSRPGSTQQPGHSFYLQAAQTLVDFGADAGKKVGDQPSAFSQAMSFYRFEFVDFFLPTADLLETDSSGALAARTAFKVKNIDCVKQFQERFESRELLAHPDLDPLHLWTHVPPLDRKNQDASTSCLHDLRDSACTHWLLSHPRLTQQHLEAADFEGRTPLWNAAIQGRSKIVAKLVGMGAHIDPAHPDGVHLMDEVESILRQRHDDIGQEIFGSVLQILRASQASRLANEAIDQIVSKVHQP
jgi:hypothetical protein